MKITENYSADLSIFEQYQTFDDGITFLFHDISLDLYKANHKPSFCFHLVILNYTMIHFEIYNIHHIDKEDDDKTYWK